MVTGISMVNIPLTEDFSSSNWDRYSVVLDSTTSTNMGRAANATYPWGLDTLSHIDLRTFQGDLRTFQGENLHLENWSSSGASLTLGSNSSYNHWPTLGFNYTTGSTYLA